MTTSVSNFREQKDARCSIFKKLGLQKTKKLQTCSKPEGHRAEICSHLELPRPRAHALMPWQPSIRPVAIEALGHDENKGLELEVFLQTQHEC